MFYSFVLYACFAKNSVSNQHLVFSQTISVSDARQGNLCHILFDINIYPFLYSTLLNRKGKNRLSKYEMPVFVKKRCYSSSAITDSSGAVTILQSVHTSSAVAPPQSTKVSPTVATAPNSTGTATQIF